MVGKGKQLIKGVIVKIRELKNYREHEITQKLKDGIFFS